MALAVDTSRALRTTTELTALVRAVLAATEHDETGWLELKSTLDLAEKKARFAIAKAILGFANRSTEVTAKHAEGCAYLLVGADQDGCRGVTEVDFANLEQGLSPYLGSGDAAPRWSGRYIDVDGRSVFVATIEPPRPGDRTRTLRKAYESFPAGTIFIRGLAKTEVAAPDDVAMLEDRYASGSAAPCVSG